MVTLATKCLISKSLINVITKNRLSFIQGMRAYAVLAVLFYHIDSSVVKMGWLGVNCFFVISGFVISKQIHQLYQHNSSIFKSFFVHRIKRIYPALMAMLILFTFIGLFILDPVGASQTASLTSIFSTLSVSNIYLAIKGLNYFATPIQSNPFMHTWSLSIEMQFYLLFPFIYKKLKNKHVLIAIIFLTVIQTYLYLAISPDYSQLLYFLPIGNFRDLLIGIFVFKVNQTPKLYMHNFVIPLQIFTVSILFLDVKNPAFQFMWSTVYTILFGFLIWLLKANPINANVLNLQRMQYIGNRSYSIYLMHWPIICFHQILFGKLNLLNSFIVLTLIFFLSDLSFKYIETMRFQINLTPYLISFITLSLILSFLIGSFSARALVEFKNQQRHFVKVGQVGTLNVPNLSSILESNCVNYKFNKSCLISRHVYKISPIFKYPVMVIGDSHAGVFINQITEMHPGREIIYVNTNFLTNKYNQDGKQIQTQIDNYEPQNIFLIANFDRLGSASNNIQNLLNNNSNTHFLMFQDNPNFYFNAFRCAYGLSLFIKNQRCDASISNIRKENYFIKNLKSTNLTSFNLKEIFCNQNFCSMGNENEIYFFDDNHLNTNGVKLVLGKIKEDLISAELVK